MEKTNDTNTQIPSKERYSEADIAFLDSIFQKRAKGQVCPDCKSTARKTYKWTKGTRYQCRCLHPAFPLAGTPMESTHARLSLWKEILLMRITNGGICVKALLIDHGGSYKTYRGMLVKIDNWLTSSLCDHERSRCPEAVIDKMLGNLPPLFSRPQRKTATIKSTKNDLRRKIR